MEAKYFKDYKYNYLILKWEGTETEKSYQQKMLESNKMERLLKCSIRYINGAAYYYYDISSKVSLKNLYQGKKMSYGQVKDFLEQMDSVYGELEQYFLEETGLLIQPEYIYYDISSRKYYGVYYPRLTKEQDTETSEGNLYEPLMDFLLNHIDTKDQKAVDNIYQIYELSEEQFFSLADALPFFEEKVEETQEFIQKETVEAAETVETEDFMYEIEADGANKSINHGTKNNTRNSNTIKDNTSNSNSTKDNTKDNKKDNTKGFRGQRKWLYFAVFAVFSLCGLAGEFWIYWEYQLTNQELLMLLGCAVITFLCFGFSMVQCVLSARRNRRREAEDILLQQDIENEFRDFPTVSLDGVVSREMDSSKVQEDGAEAWQRNQETIFIDIRKQGTEYKLYALDKKNKQHIALTKFPFTIGKMGGFVDYVIEDESISRLHARIDKQENMILLTDMNSTNGTYKNGLRMNPSETVEIEPGDEIRFGKVNYCYR